MLKTINGGSLPSLGTEFSACVDVYANADVLIGGGDTAVVPLGLTVDLDFIKRMFLCDDSDATSDELIDFARSHYPVNFDSWLSGLGSKNDSFEFDLYDEESVSFSSIPVAEFNSELCSSHRVSFDYRAYVNFMKSHVFELFNRSSTALKRGLILANGTGLIDMDFNEEIGAILHNPLRMRKKFVNGTTYSELEEDYDAEISIKKGDKICQIKLGTHETSLMGFKSDIKRDGGFGSTGS